MTETTLTFTISMRSPATTKTVNISNPKAEISQTEVEDFVDGYSTVYQDDYSLTKAYYTQSTRTYVYGAPVV